MTVISKRWLRQGVWWAAAVVLAGALAATVTLLFGSRTPGAPTARARVYSSFRACLLTGAGGITDPQAAPVWAGMEDASLRTSAMVSYLAVTGPATKDNALSFLSSLVLRHCDVVVTSGAAERAAVVAEAARFSGVKFVLTGGTSDGPVAGLNITAVAAGVSARSAIASVIATDAGA